MSYQLQQTRRFARAYKKLHNSVAADTDAAVAVVAKDPSVCELRRGGLAALHVYDFLSQGQLYLLGYTVDDDIRLVYLEAVGSHENFYRDRKRPSNPADENAS